MDVNYEKKLVVVMVALITPILVIVVVQADDHSRPFDAPLRPPLFDAPHCPPPLRPPSSAFTGSANTLMRSKVICSPKCLLRSITRAGRKKKKNKSP
jgi:hypothetical protein